MEMRCVFANGGRAEPIRPRNRKRLRPYMASQALVFSILQNRNSMAAHPCEAGKANCKTETVLQCRKILHLRVRRNQLFRQRFLIHIERCKPHPYCSPKRRRFLVRAHFFGLLHLLFHVNCVKMGVGFCSFLQRPFGRFDQSLSGSRQVGNVRCFF